MKTNLRHAQILELQFRDPKDKSLVTAVKVAAACVLPISPFAFVCPFCNSVHTVNNPKCKDPARFLSVKDPRSGKERQLSPKWQILVQAPCMNQSTEQRAAAGDLSEWLYNQGLAWVER